MLTCANSSRSILKGCYVTKRSKLSGRRNKGYLINNHCKDLIYSNSNNNNNNWQSSRDCISNSSSSCNSNSKNSKGSSRHNKPCRRKCSGTCPLIIMVLVMYLKEV